MRHLLPHPINESIDPVQELLPYSQWLLEMWDTSQETEVLEKTVEGESAMYVLDIDGDEYAVNIIAHRNPDNPESISLEVHFSSKVPGQETHSNALTGRNNMQKVMGAVWWIIRDWAKTVCKGGVLGAIVVVAKSETPGDARRARIYGDFLLRKVQQAGTKVVLTQDITEFWREASGSSTDSIVTKYRIEPVPVSKIASI